MYDEINQQLKEAQQKIFRLQKIDAMLKELIKQKWELQGKIAGLKAALDKEDIDVDKLEGKSLAHMFHSILGNLDEKLQKEQQEALAARLKYDQALREQEGLDNEISKLTAERKQYDGCEAAYQKLYDRKKEQLLQSNSETAHRILGLMEQINSAQNTRKEVREAIGAGSEVMRHINSTSNSLDSAAGWGTWDIIGGGLLSDLAKHSHIDEAKAEAERTQMALSKFRTELADVKIDSSINIDIGGFGKFADFFFDGLIADWCMQSRIHDSQDSVENVKAQVQMVMTKLSNMECNLLALTEKLENDLNELIVNA